MITTVGLFLLYNFTRFYDIWLIVIMACNCTWNNFGYLLILYRKNCQMNGDVTIRTLYSAACSENSGLTGSLLSLNIKVWCFPQEMSKIDILLILLDLVEDNWRCVVLIAPQDLLRFSFFSKGAVCTKYKSMICK